MGSQARNAIMKRENFVQTQAQRRERRRRGCGDERLLGPLSLCAIEAGWVELWHRSRQIATTSSPLQTVLSSSSGRHLKGQGCLGRKNLTFGNGNSPPSAMAGPVESARYLSTEESSGSRTVAAAWTAGEHSLFEGKGHVMRNFQRTAKVAVGLLGLALSYSAAACCPDVGHSPAAATTGLGASRPSATDLSAVSTLHVYTFERDGIRYLQVNGPSGDVRTAIGWIDGTRWVMPVGIDADRTTILAAGSRPSGTVVYEGDGMTVLLQTLPRGNSWLIVPKN